MTVLVALVAAAAPEHASADQPVHAVTGDTLDEAQRLFYSGRYDAAAALALVVRTAAPDLLVISELARLRSALPDTTRSRHAREQGAGMGTVRPM